MWLMMFYFYKVLVSAWNTHTDWLMLQKICTKSNKGNPVLKLIKEILNILAVAWNIKHCFLFAILFCCLFLVHYLFYSIAVKGHAPYANTTFPVDIMLNKSRA